MMNEAVKFLTEDCEVDGIKDKLFEYCRRHCMQPVIDVSKLLPYPEYTPIEDGIYLVEMIDKDWTEHGYDVFDWNKHNEDRNKMSYGINSWDGKVKAFIKIKV